jgi:6-pyruvoyl-tetrahydropterin synthase
MHLERRYEAEAAHQLSAGVPEGHPCRRLHGHRYVFTVIIGGDVHPDTGMILEYADVDARVMGVLGFIDHRFTNMLGFEARVVTSGHSDLPVITSDPIPGLRLVEEELAEKVRENSTVENLGAWFVAELKHRFPRDTLKVGPSSLRAPHVACVRIEEDSRSVFEIWCGESVKEPTAA